MEKFLNAKAFVAYRFVVKEGDASMLLWKLMLGQKINKSPLTDNGLSADLNGIKVI